LNELINKIESIIFCSPEPISIDQIINCIEEEQNKNVSKEKIKILVEKLIQKFRNDSFSFEIIKIGGGYQFLSKSEYSKVTQILLKQHSNKRLSISALETLSIIAYKQPIIKSKIEQIRGVNCDYTINKLLEKNLIEIKGKSEKVGRPLIYITSQYFINYFGINNLNELPTIKDFSKEENMIGDEAQGE